MTATIPTTTNKDEKIGLLSISRAAELSGAESYQIRRMIQRGLVPAKKVGGMYFVREEAVPITVPDYREVETRKLARQIVKRGQPDHINSRDWGILRLYAAGKSCEDIADDDDVDVSRQRVHQLILAMVGVERAAEAEAVE